MNRREFLKLSGVGLAGLAMSSFNRRLVQQERNPFPEGEALGRAIATIPVRPRPDIDSPEVRRMFEDEVFPVLRKVVGRNPFRINQTFLETPEGYVWSPDVQPVVNQPQQPQTSLPSTSLGEGMWVEVSVPYVDLTVVNPPARAPWLKNRLDLGLSPRFYNSQIAWVDFVEIENDGRVFYRINERFGYGDQFRAPADAFRPLTAEEIAPISPDVEDKRIVVDINRQTMACFEGNTEVYFARVSTGALYTASGTRVDEWATPPGTHRIWRKAVSLPLTGGSADTGWALPAVGWISLFVGSGVAFHSTYWHNNYGVPTSRGCVNCAPEDAKWVFRWTAPQVPYDPGDVTIGMPGGTAITVVES